MRIFYLSSFLIASCLILSPVSMAFAAPPVGFDCCRCNAMGKPEFCVLTPQGKPCDTVQKTLNGMLSVYKTEVECEQLENSKCSKVSTGASGTCPNEPAIVSNLGKADLAQFTTSTIAAAPANTIDIKMELGVPIPGVSFPTKFETKDNKIIVPYLAIYIVGFQKYLLALTLIAAAVMIIYGGFLYIMSSTGAKVREGKEIIKDALIGLGVTFGAVVILANINPQTSVFKPLQIDIVERKDTPADPMQATQMVQQSATAEDGKIVQNVQGYIAQGLCPPDMITIKHSESYKIPAKDKNPSSFCIDRFEAPNKKCVKPNENCVKPIRGANEWEAEWYCQDRGKRLCTYSEWVRACLGPNGTNTYGYGPDYIEGQIKDAGKTQVIQGQTLNMGVTAKTGKPPAPCNYDSTMPLGWQGYEHVIQPFNGKYPTKRNKEYSILNPLNPRLSDSKYLESYNNFTAEIKKFDGSEPSGTRVGCVTAEGVFDMSGNVAEMTVKDEYSQLTVDQRVALPVTPRAYVWAGFDWSPIPHLASINGKPTCTFTSGGGHGGGDGWRDYINGFRCCLNLNDTPTAPTP
ncbi:MAG: pilin [Patescibacteria group bacterium]